MKICQKKIICFYKIGIACMLTNFFSYLSCINNLFFSEKKTNKTKIKPEVTAHVRDIMRGIMALEYDFYIFVKELFDIKFKALDCAVKIV